MTTGSTDSHLLQRERFSNQVMDDVQVSSLTILEGYHGPFLLIFYAENALEIYDRKTMVAKFHHSTIWSNFFFLSLLVPAVPAAINSQ